MQNVVFLDDAVHYYLKFIKPVMIGQVVAAGEGLVILPDKPDFTAWKASIMQ